MPRKSKDARIAIQNHAQLNDSYANPSCTRKSHSSRHAAQSRQRFQTEQLLYMVYLAPPIIQCLECTHFRGQQLACWAQAQERAF